MTPEQFCYWLQGFYEISGSKEISKEQSQIIQDHLNHVFKKETPNRVPTLTMPSIPHDLFGPVDSSVCPICEGKHQGLACPRIAITC